MSSEDVDVLPIIKTWLESSHARIESFWIGASWRAWAQFELFMALEKSLQSTCLVTHSNDDFWVDSADMVDVLIEPREGQSESVAIVLRCERVNENEGSFETFAEQFDADWTRLQGMKVQNEFEGTRIILLGFSGEDVGDGIDTFKMEPKPDRSRSGEVVLWIKEHPVQS